MTVLFSDASGYTEMAEHLDPEVVRELMNLVYDKAGEIVSRYGGRIDKLMGDAVLAVFGDPVVHEDDAERAVRAALELHSAVNDLRPDFEARTGHSFAMHSGINSGVVITSDLHGDRASGPLGDMVNVASRLQSLASAGEILIGPETRSLVAGRFELTDLGERELKGRREPVRVTRVDGLRAAQERPSRRAGAFIGRQEELGVLLGAVDRLRDGESSLVTVCAEAGAGKSRLLEEVRSRLGHDVQWLEGRAYPYTANIPYAPSSICSTAPRRSTSTTAQPKSAPSSTRWSPACCRATTARWQHSLTSTASLPSTEPSISRRSSRCCAPRSARLSTSSPARAPTVVCLQDLHWVDPSTATLVRELVGTISEPVVMVCNFRPGFALGAPNERVIHLSELSQRQTREQLVSLLDGAEPPDELLSLVIARTDGNPFFVEEIVNRLIETDVLARQGDRWVLATRLDEVTVPATIRGLDRGAHRQPRAGSPPGASRGLGRRPRVPLPDRAVRHGAPDDLDDSLAGLSAADLIRERNHDPDLEYIFKHALTQEVAYDGLLRRDRQVLHERVARGVEALLGDRTEEFVETLAYHYERSGHVVEAVGYLRRAGRKALDRYAIAEAHRQYRAAYDLLIADDDDTNAVDPATRDRLLIETILEWAQCHYYTCAITGLHDLQDRHRDLLVTVGDEVLTARWTAWRGMTAWQQGQVKDAERLLTDAVGLAERCNDATAHGYALAWLTWVAPQGGDTARAVAIWPALEALVPRVADAHDRQYVHIKGLGGVGLALASRGDIKGATARADELLEIGRRTGNRRASAMGYMVMVVVAFARGDEYAAKAGTQAAIDCDADPMYMFFAEAWATGLAIGSSGTEEARRRFDVLEARWRDVGADVNPGQLAAFRYQLDVLSGHLSRGMGGLDDLREQEQALGNADVVGNIDSFTAILHARLATGDVGGTAAPAPPAALRDRAFLRAHRVGAAKKARVALEQLGRTFDERGDHGRRVAVEFELAKIAKHERRNDDARAHLQTVQQLLAGAPDASLCLRANGMLVELD